MYVDPGNYVGFGNLKRLTKLPNQGYTKANPTSFTDCELPKYEYVYNMNHLHLASLDEAYKLKNEGDTTAVPAIKLHDWRDQNQHITKLRAGMEFNHGWVNPSQFKHPLTNVTVVGKTTIHGHLLNNAEYAYENLSGLNITSDGSLNVCNMPAFDTPTDTEYLKINNPGGKRTVMHSSISEDYNMADVANINQNYVPSMRPDETRGISEDNKHILRPGIYCVANRTLLNYELYTTEDPPKNVYINVPQVIRPNNKNDNVYAEFRIAYDATVTTWYDQYEHPQVIQTRSVAAADSITAVANIDHSWEKYDITKPMRHLHGNQVKQCLHRRTTDMQDTTHATFNHTGRFANA